VVGLFVAGDDAVAKCALVRKGLPVRFHVVFVLQNVPRFRESEAVVAFRREDRVVVDADRSVGGFFLVPL
jgi:hypothetical protein